MGPGNVVLFSRKPSYALELDRVAKTSVRKFIYLLKYLFLVILGLCCSMWNLSLKHVGSSLTKG